MIADPQQGARLVAAADRVRTDLAEQRSLWDRGFTRRRLLAGAGMVATASLASQLVTTRYAFAAPRPHVSTGKTLVTVFLRGGLDGLSAVVPGADPNYTSARPRLAIPSGSLLPLDSRFGLHPACAALYPFWQNRQLAVVQAAGFPDANRSHFDAQTLVECGVVGAGTSTGWLERVLEVDGPGTTFRAVSEGTNLAASLAGTAGAVAMQGIDSLKFTTGTPEATQALQTLYTGLDNPAEQQMTTTLQVVAAAVPIQATNQRPAPGANYPNDSFAAAMADIARMIKANAGLRAATVDVGGWDVHTAAGTVSSGTMTANLGAFAATMAAFAIDLGSRISDATVVTMSEFGRRVPENGSGGTDHGHGGLMFLLGGGVNGGIVHGSWPGLAPEDLDHGDLAITNDYRDVAGEAAQKTLNLGSMSSVFPGHTYRPLGVMR